MQLLIDVLQLEPTEQVRGSGCASTNLSEILEHQSEHANWQLGHVNGGILTIWLFFHVKYEAKNSLRGLKGCVCTEGG